jgi:Ca2+-transporting ATPase
MGKKELKLLNQRWRILVDDDLSKMIVAVSAGRRIYTNLKQFKYIVSIHIPITYGCITLCFLMDISDIFTPVHVIFLN